MRSSPEHTSTEKILNACGPFALSILLSLSLLTCEITHSSIHSAMKKQQIKTEQELYREFCSLLKIETKTQLSNKDLHTYVQRKKL
jgi:hypothetical protein